MPKKGGKAADAEGGAPEVVKRIGSVATHCLFIARQT